MPTLSLYHPRSMDEVRNAAAFVMIRFGRIRQLSISEKGDCATYSAEIVTIRDVQALDQQSPQSMDKLLRDNLPRWIQIQKTDFVNERWVVHFTVCEE